MEQYEHTTFTLDMLGRNICNTFDEATQDPENIDVVVIGSGMSGAYVASDIYNRSLTETQVTQKRLPLRIVVLEAGPFVAFEHVQNMPNVGLNVPGPEYVGPGSHPAVRDGVWGQGWRSNVDYTGQAYCLGGKSIYWGGWYPRQNYQRDIPQWPKEMQNYMTSDKFPNPQPYSKSTEVHGAYEYLEYQTGVKPGEDFVFDANNIKKPEVLGGLNYVLFEYFKTNSKKLNVEASVAPIAVSTRSDASGMLANNKFSSLPILISAIRTDRSDPRWGSPRLCVVPNTHVRLLRSSTDNEGVPTRFLEFIDVVERGEFKTLRIPPTCQVVLAGSTIESTRLALESFSLVDSHLRPPGHELMGNNLHTHHRFDFFFRCKKAFLNDFSEKTTHHQLSKLLQVACLHIQGVVNAGEPQYQYQLFSASNKTGTADDLLYHLVPSLDVVRLIDNNQDSEWISIILRASGEMSTNRSDVRKEDFVDLASMQDYDWENRNKRAWVQWGSHRDAPIWATMYNKAVEISHAFGNEIEYFVNGVWRKDPPSFDSIRDQQGLGTTYHEAGTLWMGEQPSSSVADTNGHFHHVPNAYIADQAAFPTVAVANPVPTGLCVARKVALDIFSRHQSYSAEKGENIQGANDNYIPLITSEQQYHEDWASAGRGNFNLLKVGSDPSKDWIIEAKAQDGGIGFLYYKKQTFTNFELRVQWKAFRTAPGEETANSGILCHVADPTKPQSNAQDSETFVEIQIDESGKDYRGPDLPPIYGNSLYKTGAVYGVSPATQWAAKVAAPENCDGYWNEFRITIKGPKASVELNHKKVVVEAALPPTKNATGYIALQAHTGKVQFRNIRIKQLDSESSTCKDAEGTC